MSRWKDHEKKPIAEDCVILDITRLAVEKFFHRQDPAMMTYFINGESVAEIGLIQQDEPLGVWVFYGNLHYLVPVVTRKMKWGAIWYQFQCSHPKPDGTPCGMVVKKLYLPPGAERFACKMCHNISWRSRQTWDKRIAHFKKNPELAGEVIKALLASKDRTTRQYSQPLLAVWGFTAFRAIKVMTWRRFSAIMCLR